MDLGELKWDADGLVTVVAQDAHTGEVRMVAHADRAALEATLAQGQACFFSRSRGAPWKKGESSGHTMAVREVWVDCDGDAVIYLVDPAGPSCHTSRRTCFFRRVDRYGELESAERHADPTLVRLWDTLRVRTHDSAERSYTKKLLEGGSGAINDKIREEAAELARAIEDESDERVVAEMADLVYHAAVGLLARGVTLRDVEAELARRFGQSGHDEKASRGR